MSKAAPTATLRIRIECVGAHDLEAIERGFPIRWFRLFVRVQLQLTNGWSRSFRAVLDTGSPYCVIPQSLVPDLDRNRLFQTRLAGIVPASSSKGFLPADLVRTRIALGDTVRTTRPIETLGMVVQHQGVPLIIGLAAFPRSVRIDVDFRRETAFLSLPHLD